MPRKNATHPGYYSANTVDDESFEVALAIRAGRLTRSQFDEWYKRRRADRAGLVITLRQKPARARRARRTGRRK